MKSGFRIFLGALLALGASWCGLVLGPVLQLGGETQTTVLNSSDLYPVGRPGLANQGAQVYRADGCAACHTEQVQQSGIACNVELAKVGTNNAAVLAAAMKINPNLSDLRHTILSTPDKQVAQAAVHRLAAAGAKAEIHFVATGPDITWNWGSRHSVAADYLYDDPVELGSLRLGPDLANVGVRLPDAGWQLQHLYAPQSVVKDSAMPSFRYLFRVRKIGRRPSPDALKLPPPYAPPAGYEVVPTPEAKELAAYLLSLRCDVPLYQAPFTPAAPGQP